MLKRLFGGKQKDDPASRIFASAHQGRTAPTRAEIQALKTRALENAYTRLKGKKIERLPKGPGTDFRKDFHDAKDDARNEALQRAETAHLLQELRKKKLIAHGRGSNLFMEKTDRIKALFKATSKSGIGEGIGQLKELGIYGVLGHSFIRFFAARPYVKAKTNAVASAIEMLAASKSKNFRRMVFATARFLHDNHRNSGTAIYDPRAESIIYEVFGKLARKNNDFKKIYNVSGETSNVGKQFFRYLINENIIKNFRSLKTMHDKPDFELKMEALRYCTVGDRVDSSEKNYARMLDFIHDVFQPGNEVSTLDTYERMKEKGKPHHIVFNNALQALISLQYKAKRTHNIEPAETQSYFRKVCDYYSIKQESVHRYAFDLFYSIRAPKLEDFSDPSRTRLLHVREMAKEVYQFAQNPPRNRTHRKRGGKQILSPGVEIGVND